MTLILFATCTPGLEEILSKEAASLGYTAKLGKGGVEIEVQSLADAMVLNLHLRTASRVLLRLFEIDLPSKQGLYHTISTYDWRPWFVGMPTMAIDVPFAAHSEFSNTHYVAQLAKDGICDMLRRTTGKRPSVDTKAPQIQFSLVLDDKKAFFSFDTSLQPLFKRGYRTESVEAPLKETLAAALLMIAGYTPEATLFDPCCGGGTFIIEAGLMATKTPPGLFRDSFGFFRHPSFDPDEWRAIRQKASDAIVPYPRGKLFGSEKEAKSYRYLLRGIARAGLMNSVELFHSDFRDVRLPVKPNFVISNPPFGVRLGEEKRWGPLYRAIGDFMKQSTAKPAVGAIITASRFLSQEIGLKAKRKINVSHGGLDCIFCLYDLFDGAKTEIAR